MLRTNAMITSVRVLRSMATFYWKVQDQVSSYPSVMTIFLKPTLRALLKNSACFDS